MPRTSFVASSTPISSAVVSYLTAWFTARSSRLRVVIPGPLGSAEIEADGRNVANEETVARALNVAVWESTMRLPDSERSWAVLIGTSTYADDSGFDTTELGGAGRPSQSAAGRRGRVLR